MKTHVNSLKSFSFLEIISPKLFGNSWGNSYVQFLVYLLFYLSTTPWLRFQQEAEWVNITFERTDLNFLKKSHSSPDDSGKMYFFLCFQFKKTKCNRFFFHIFNTKLCAVPLNYYCQALYVSPHPTNGDISDNGCSSVPLDSAYSPPWYVAPSNSHIQK